MAVGLAEQRRRFREPGIRERGRGGPRRLRLQVAPPPDGEEHHDRGRRLDLPPARSPERQAMARRLPCRGLLPGSDRSLHAQDPREGPRRARPEIRGESVSVRRLPIAILAAAAVAGAALWALALAQSPGPPTGLDALEQKSFVVAEDLTKELSSAVIRLPLAAVLGAALALPRRPPG